MSVDRRSLLGQLDSLKRRVDESGVLDSADAFQQQAFDVIVGGISEAFDISKEPRSIVERYDTSGIDIPASLYKKKNKNLLNQSPVSLGKQMLMARRLVEAGCGFVTVTSAGWNMHGNAFGVDAERKPAPADKPSASPPPVAATPGFRSRRLVLDGRLLLSPEPASGG